MLKKDFLKAHMEIVKTHKNLELTPKILPAWGRGRWFLSNLPNPTGNVLDLCGGFGYWGAYVLKVGGYEFDYTCLDKHEICTSFGPEYFKLLDINGSFIQHDINNPLPFMDESFNQTWLFGWWVEKFDYNKIFNEIHRILKDRGLFLLDAATMKTVGHGKPYPLCFTEQGLVESLERSGFKILKLDTFYRSRWKQEKHKFHGLLCIKPRHYIN